MVFCGDYFGKTTTKKIYTRILSDFACCAQSSIFTTLDFCKHPWLIYSFPTMWSVFSIFVLRLLFFPKELSFSEKHQQHHLPFLPFKANSSCIEGIIYHISHPAYKSNLKIKCHKVVCRGKLIFKRHAISDPVLLFAVCFLK